MARAFPSAVIENIRPLIDGGRYPVKRIVEDDLAVEADVFKDGHDVVAAALKWRLVGEPRWHETAMSLVDNDRWRGICSLNEIGVYEYTVEAWTDSFRSWRDEFTKKFEAGISDLTAEALEGAALIETAGKRAHVADDSTRLCELSECIRTADNAQIMLTANGLSGLANLANPGVPTLFLDQVHRVSATAPFSPLQSISGAGTANAGKRLIEGLDVTAIYDMPTERFGEFTFSGIRVGEAGSVRVQVSFNLTQDGILTMSAKDRDTSKEMTTTVKLGLKQ